MRIAVVHRNDERTTSADGTLSIDPDVRQIGASRWYKDKFSSVLGVTRNWVGDAGDGKSNRATGRGRAGENAEEGNGQNEYAEQFLLHTQI